MNNTECNDRNLMLTSNKCILTTIKKSCPLSDWEQELVLRRWNTVDVTPLIVILSWGVTVASVTVFLRRLAVYIASLIVFTRRLTEDKASFSVDLL